MVFLLVFYAAAVVTLVLVVGNRWFLVTLSFVAILAFVLPWMGFSLISSCVAIYCLFLLFLLLHEYARLINWKIWHHLYPSTKPMNADISNGKLQNTEIVWVWDGKVEEKQMWARDGTG